MVKSKSELLDILKELEEWDETTQHRLVELLLDALKPQPMTYEQFLAWSDEDTLAEWVNGEIVMTSPASKQHQELNSFLYKLFSSFVETHDLGTVIQAPFQMKLVHSGREPDLIFVARENLERLKSTYLDGPADLVVEIVSPESAGRDRGEKFYEYEQAGIPEYWLVDPVRQQVEFYQLAAQKRYNLIAPDAEDIYRSAILSGFWIRVAWLWQDPLPAAEELLLDIGGEAYAHRWIERLQRRGFLPAE